ncbi:MAG: Gfo/Idh/MocA family oxidoreductase [Thermoanaerobaculia bacterium]
MDEPKKIRIGIVGTGYLGRLHARVLTEMPEVDVAGFVEPDDGTAAEVEKSLGLKRVGSASELADLAECAVIATPTTHHAEVATLMMRAGCDVMIEKPIATTVEEAQGLIELAATEKRIVQVGHVERYNPAIVALAEVLEPPRYIEADRLGVFSARSLDIDVLLDLMIHDLNLVLSLGGSDVEEIRAVGVPVLTDKVDMANVRLQLANGAVANLTASRVSSERVRKLRIFSRDSYASVDTREQEVKLFRLRSGGASREIEPVELAVERKEPLRAELESFVHCVRTRREPLVTGADGLKALDLAVRVRAAIEESLRAFDRAGTTR